MEIRSSAEDYLETILLLAKKTGPVRSIDVATEMGVTKPSVSLAMKKLREKELITMDENGYIKLTEKGSLLAEDVYDRHSALYDWLISIGVSKQNAAVDACRMEHAICKETFEAIKKSCSNCPLCK